MNRTFASRVDRDLHDLSTDIAATRDYMRLLRGRLVNAGVDAEMYDQAIGNINGAIMLLDVLERDAATGAQP